MISNTTRSTMMQSGQNSQGPIAKPETAVAVEHDHTQLSVSQRIALHQVLNNRDQVVALEGVAGAGKTTTLAAVRDAAEREGYVVEGFAPTSRAAHQLAEAGIPSRTLQRHLSHTNEEREPRPHLYILDESSLASTKQMNAFLHRLQTNDRVLLVGDVRQHEAVEAGQSLPPTPGVWRHDGSPG